ncbi:MAG: amidohydrolase [Bradymonadia bacterium]
MKALSLLVALLAVPAWGQPAVDLRLEARAALSFDAQGRLIEHRHGEGVAIAIHKGHITWIGPTHTGPEGKSLIREPEAIVVPGLVDAHGHLTGLGQALERLDLRSASSPSAVAAQVKRAAAEAAEGQWITGRGWDQNLWPGGAFPTHEILSAAVPDRPVVLTRVDGHAIWVNARVLQHAGINGQTPDPQGGQILRDASGQPTGVLIDSAVDLVRQKMPEPSEADITRWVLRAVAACRAVGLTGVHDAGATAAQVKVYRQLAQQGQLGFRVHVLLDDQDPHIAPLVEAGPQRGDMVQVMGVKLFADGALGSRGASLLSDYTDAHGHKGTPIITGDVLIEKVNRYAAKGFQIGVHGIGDAAVREIVDAYAGLPKDQRHRMRVEHAQIVHPDDQRRMGEMGIIASVQPVHATSDMGWAEKRLGPERIRHAYAWRSLVNAGAPLALGSDFPVESPDPLAGLYAAVTRQKPSGPKGGWYAAEALTPAEALRGFTLDAAFASFTEDRRGRIAVGQVADLTLLSADPRERAQLETLKTLGVLVAGKRYLGGESKLPSKR